MKLVRFLLYPLSWLYGIGVGLRNKLFDWGWLRSKSFDVPVICVGNLAVGGTGKTPHTEYLIRLLRKAGLNVAVLSRGYKRKSRGYVLADINNVGTHPGASYVGSLKERSNLSELRTHQGASLQSMTLGDEPCQMKQKFPDVRVAVDEDRCHGIEQLMKLQEPQVDAIILDDAFQHRYVKAGLYILLTDYHRLLCHDALLPAGRLREPANGKDRAHIVIVTKCSDDIKPIDFNIIAKQLHLYPWQQLFFSKIRYGELETLFPDVGTHPGASYTGSLKERSYLSDVRTHPGASLQDTALLVTGVANPQPLLKEMQNRAAHVKLLSFADHHDFTAKDLLYIKKEFLRLEEGRRLIVTTEKDAARLRHHPALSEDLKPYIYVLPIEVEILQGQQETFNQTIIDYVRTHTRNSSLPERKDAHTA